MDQYAVSLFLFHRDLRVEDNTALLAALKESQQVITLFIIDPVQVCPTNPYRGDHAVQCLVESLHDLSAQLTSFNGRLSLWYGSTIEVLHTIIDNHQIKALYSNADYTPFARARDAAIEKLCDSLDIDFFQFHDSMLNEPSLVTKDDKKPYVIFTPYYKKALTLSIPAINTTVRSESFSTMRLKGEESHDTLFKKIKFTPSVAINVSGGRTAGLALLKKSAAVDYKAIHDYPAQKTTFLAAHLKFGTVSVREVYHYFKKHAHYSELLVRQLYWRDFFSAIVFYFPHVIGNAFHAKYNELSWNNNETMFNAWCHGKTGFPIVDAGMRQLNTTGYMHNRVRMIVASFLVKDLHIDWRLGERYFAQKLVDYDPAVNNGNWQWAASTGCDAQPYFRIFNPWLQQKKFDPDCVYIKQWVSELKKFDSTLIHTLYKKKSSPIKGYPQPLVDHEKESRVAKAMYKGAKHLPQ